MNGLLVTLTIVALVGSGVVAGIFYAFSSFVMPALNRLAPAGAAEAMNAINVMAVTPPFMSVLLGTAVLSTGLGVVALFRLGEPGAIEHLVAAPVYLSCIAVTRAYHVPRNDALASASANWSTYCREWTMANHLRALAPAAAAVVYALALRAG